MTIENRRTHRLGLTVVALLGVAATACGGAAAARPAATASSSPKLAPPSGPDTVDLQAQSRGSCQTGNYPGSFPAIGHVTIARTAKGTITADITMDHGRPNQPYQVELVQMPNNIPYAPVSCGGPTTVFTTDVSGHGTGYISVAAAPGATRAAVHVLGLDPMLGVIATPAVTFP